MNKAASSSQEESLAEGCLRRNTFIREHLGGVEGAGTSITLREGCPDERLSSRCPSHIPTPPIRPTKLAKNNQVEISKVSSIGSPPS
jgi:hypothetical protein